MNATSNAVDQLLIGGLDDWLHFPEVVLAAAPGAERGDELAAAPTVLDFIRSMLHDQLVRVGELAENGFASWNLDEEEAIRRITSRWKAPRSRLHIGDVCWFELTPHGRERAEEAWLSSSAADSWH